MAKSIKELISSLPPDRQEVIEALANQIAKDMIADADSLVKRKKKDGDKREALPRRKAVTE